MRKLVIAATAVGRLLAFENEHGAEVWSTAIAQPGDSIWRIALASPSVLLVVTHSPATGYTIHEVDPLSGALSSSRAVTQHLETLVVTPYVTESDQRIVLLTDGDAVFVHPHSAEALALLQPHLSTLFYHHVDLATDTITGYSLSSALHDYPLVSSTRSSLRAAQVWQLSFPATEHVAAIAASHPFHTVQSSVRLVGGGDGGVLYKYLNPNLLLVATERGETAGRRLVPSVKRSTDPSVSVYLLDTVSGAVYEKWVHRGGAGPVHAVQSENLLVYHYLNAATQHYELSVVELYEPRDADALTLLHAVQSVGAASPPLSSFTEPPPYAIQATFLMRTAVKGLTVSHTLRGITSKEVIALLPTDQLLALPKPLLDPRRPTAAEPSALDRAEGLVPYSGELSWAGAQVLNYNRTVMHLREAGTSPALLESTSLVCGWGVDVWCGRSAPSGGFDVLNEDFNYAFLGMTVTAVLAAIAVTRSWAKNKELALAWK